MTMDNNLIYKNEIVGKIEHKVVKPKIFIGKLLA